MSKKSKDLIAAIVAIILLVLVGYILNVGILQKEQSVSDVASSQAVQPFFLEITIIYPKENNQLPEIKLVQVKLGESAWDILKKAIGIESIEYKDYGSDLGIFIVGIRGVKPTGNEFWLFKVNGEGSKVGVSSYKVKPGDKIEFVVSEPTQNQ